MGAHQTKMMGKVALLFVVAMAASANAIVCTTTACTSTDGSTVAGGSGCYCGTDNVFVTATQFCYKKTDNTGLAFTKKICTQTTGVTSVGTATADFCTCSTTAVTPVSDATNDFCFVATNGKGFVTDLTAITCAVTTGATASTPQCYCGTHATTDPVLVPAAGFCYKKTDLTGIAFTKKICSGTGMTNGVTSVGTGGTDACTCSNVAATPLTDGTNDFCFIGANGIGFATALTEPACSVTTGATVAGAQCKCGGTSTTTSAVVVSATQFCYQKATTNEGVAFTKKICSGTGMTNGVTSVGTGGTDVCTCSNVAATPLTTATNDFCFIASNGKGFVTDLTAPACAVTTGATASTPQCYCGTHATTDPTLVPAAGFCYKGTGAVNGIAFTKKICGNTDGTTSVGATTAD